MEGRLARPGHRLGQKARPRDDGLRPSGARYWFVAHVPAPGRRSRAANSRPIRPTDSIDLRSMPRLVRTTAYIVATILVIYALTLLSDGPLEEVIDCNWTSCAPHVSER